MNVETFLFALDNIYKPNGRAGYPSPMVMAPSAVLQYMLQRTIDLVKNNYEKREAEEAILKVFQDAHAKGEIFCFSLSRSKYSRPVSIVKVVIDGESFLEIETRPNERRIFRLYDVYDTGKLPLADNAQEVGNI